VKRVYVRAAGDLVSGVLLSQIIYLFLPDEEGRQRGGYFVRATNKWRPFVTREGRRWISLERDEWGAECCISPKQFDRACDVLSAPDHKREFIVAAVWIAADTGRTRKHIAVRWERLMPELFGLLGVNLEFPKGQFSENAPEVNSGLPQRAISTNQEISSEIAESEDPEPDLPPQPEKTEAEQVEEHAAEFRRLTLSTKPKALQALFERVVPGALQQRVIDRIEELEAADGATHTLAETPAGLSLVTQD
jgi:hypothetical protein